MVEREIEGGREHCREISQYDAYCGSAWRL